VKHIKIYFGITVLSSLFFCYTYTMDGLTELDLELRKIEKEDKIEKENNEREQLKREIESRKNLSRKRRIKMYENNK